MKRVEFFVDKNYVWNEAMKNSEYVGEKIISEADIYEGIRLTDEDAQTLSRFWDEAVFVANEKLKEMLRAYQSDDEGYKAELELANAYDTILNESVASALSSFFVASLTAKWMKYCNKDEADKYAAEASAMIDEALSMLYSRVRPKRKPVEVIGE